jgi:glycosyltransferase involved in cell wall biosynthesis
VNRSVLLLGNHPPPYGGVPAHIVDFAPYLAARGWRVHVAMVQPSQPPGLPVLEKKGDVTIHRLTRARILGSMAAPTFLREPLGDLDLLARSPGQWAINVGVAGILARLIKREKLAMVSTYKLLSGGLYGAWLRRRLGTPHVMTIFGEIYRERARYERDKRQATRAVENCDKLVSCSAHCARSLAVLGLQADVEPVIYGIDTNAFRPGLNGAAIRAKLGIPQDRKLVLYVARMVHEMGLGTLLDAAPQLFQRDSDAGLLICGQRGELTEAARLLADRYPGRIFVYPDVPGADLPLCYAAADAVVVPSINERACLGLTIAEGMSSGKPVGAARVGGHAEVMMEGKSGLLFPPGDPAALAETLAGILADDGLRCKMGELGRERAVAALDKSLTNARMEEISLEVLSKRVAAGRPA